MKRSEAAVVKFLEGYNCAQSVFYSFCDYFDFDKNIALKLSCGFGAGIHDVIAPTLVRQAL
jgi:hypothetical protein